MFCPYQKSPDNSWTVGSIVVRRNGLLIDNLRLKGSPETALFEQKCGSGAAEQVSIPPAR
jgi:hypothetical protein